MTVSRLCFCLSSLSWSIALIYFYSSGRIDSYLSQSLRIYTLIGGLLLAVVALFNLFVRAESQSCETCCGDHDHDHDHHHDHDHDHHHDHQHEPTASTDHGSELPAPLALALMIIPLALAWSSTVDDFSSSVLVRKGLFEDRAPTDLLASREAPTFTLEQFQQSTPKSAEGFYQIQLIDLYFASNDAELRAIFETTPIEFIGQVATEEDSPNQLRVYRLFITCCNADARPIAVRVRVPDSSQWQDQQWVKIQGTVKFEILNGMPIPLIEADSITVEEKPADSWLNSQSP